MDSKPDGKSGWRAARHPHHPGLWTTDPQGTPAQQSAQQLEPSAPWACISVWLWMPRAVSLGAVRAPQPRLALGVWGAALQSH